MKRSIKFRHYFEATGIYTLMTIFAVLPVDRASGFGGWLARMIGPRTRLHRIAKKQVIDILGPDNADEIVRGMWDNLGRTIAEYPHLGYIAQHRITLDNRAQATIGPEGKSPAIFISGHFANWEVSALSLIREFNTAPDLIYRPPNNPLINKLLNHYRSLYGQLRIHSKSRNGMRGVIASLNAGRTIGILIDQKYNEGIAVPFFGRPAMTSTAFAELAKRFQCPIYPTQIIRENGVHFRVIVYPAMDTTAEINAVVQTANAQIETWMRQYPEQWLWVHQRWSSCTVKNITDNERSSE